MANSIRSRATARGRNRAVRAAARGRSLNTRGRSLLRSATRGIARTSRRPTSSLNRAGRTLRSTARRFGARPITTRSGRVTGISFGNRTRNQRSFRATPSVRSSFSFSGGGLSKINPQTGLATRTTGTDATGSRDRFAFKPAADVRVSGQRPPRRVNIGFDQFGRPITVSGTEANKFFQTAERNARFSRPTGSDLKTILDDAARKFAESRGIDVESRTQEKGEQTLINLGQVSQKDLLELRRMRLEQKAEELGPESRDFERTKEGARKISDILTKIGAGRDIESLREDIAEIGFDPDAGADPKEIAIGEKIIFDIFGIEPAQQNDAAARLAAAGLTSSGNLSMLEKIATGQASLAPGGTINNREFFNVTVDGKRQRFFPGDAKKFRAELGLFKQILSGASRTEEVRREGLTPLQAELEALQRERDISMRTNPMASPFKDPFFLEERRQEIIDKHEGVAAEGEALQQEQAALSQANQEASAVRQTANSMQDGVFGALTQQLPEELQFLGDAFRQMNSALSSTESDVAGIADERLRLAEAVHQGQITMLDGFQRMYQQERSTLQGILDDVRDDTVSQLADTEARADERLQWERTKITRELERQKNSEIEQATAALAISGGFGSSNGIRAIEDAERAWDEAIADVGTEFALKRADLAVQFNGKYVEVQNQYRLDTFNATKEFNRLNQQILQQGFSSSVARAQAEERALSDYITQIGSIREKKASNILSLATSVHSIVNQERNQKRLDKNSAFEQLKWYKSAFGSNPPEGVVDDLQSRLPGVDVQSFFDTKTLDEIEKLQGSSSGGGSGYFMSFSPSETDSTGAPLTLDQFIANKISDLEDEEQQSFSPEKRSQVLAANKEAWETEYETKKQNVEQFDPATIVQRLNDKMSQPGIAKHTRENAQKVVDGYLKGGQIGLASEYVAGLGKPVPPSQSKSFQALMSAVWQIERIDNIIDDLGTQGPAVGRLRGVNPWDDKFVELDQLLTQVTPQLARGVFLEVGVLTDNDINRYKTTLGKGSLTYSQAKTAQKNLRDLVQKSLELQLGTWESTGHRTSDLRNFYDSNYGESVQRQRTDEPMSTADQADVDYIQSLYAQ